MLSNVPARIYYISFLLTVSWFSHTASAQTSNYRDSLTTYRQNYVNNHEVVNKDDRKYISFYDIDEKYRVLCSFRRISDEKGFVMNTSSGMQKKFFYYGVCTFRLHDSLEHLYVYQSASLMQQEKYKDYLFVPFGDATSGFESYGGGRYLDITIDDIKNSTLVLDFNKAYNPYCAYTTGYNCPLPPRENILSIAINAGEKNYAKASH